MKTQCKTKWTHDQWEFFLEKLVPHFCAAKYSQTQKEQDRLDRKYRLAGSYFNLIDAEFYVASTKGTVAKVLNCPSSDDDSTTEKKYKYLLDQAYHFRTKPVIAIPPGAVPQLAYENIVIPNPLTIPIQSHTSNFNVSPEFVRNACFNFTSLADKGEEFMDHHRINHSALNPDILAKALMARLPGNLSSRNVTNTNHIVWNFMSQNSKLGAALLKLHGIPLDDLRLRRRKPTDSLISGTYSISRLRGNRFYSSGKCRCWSQETAQTASCRIKIEN
mmetsp:Transcript_2810/g.4107  ORF Transcript_2810/g.4107 Transcript_2810/m.4107 type:complete len:275 (-) Transcript_2810:337-1161(-)